MADDATNSPPSTVLDMVSLRTCRAADEPDRTPRRIRAGVVASATAPCSTSGCSSRLSADEAQNLARITRDRQNGWMVTAVDVDFLLDVIGRMA